MTSVFIVRSLIFAAAFMGGWFWLIFRWLPRTVALIVALVISIPATAQSAKPDFSGTWVLNLSRSDYGPFPPPERRTDVIEHQNNTLKVTRRDVLKGAEERTGEWRCGTDSTECTNTLGGNVLKSTIRWDDATMIVETKTMYQGQEAFISDSWTLSTDRRTLSIVRRSVSPQGTAEQLFVLERHQE